MKVSIERGTLLKAASNAQSVVERRASAQILGNVLIVAEPDTVSFRATNLEVDLIDRVAAKVEQPGSTTVRAQTLNEIVRKLPDGALVRLTDDEVKSRIAIEAGRSQFHLMTLPTEDFPIMASSDFTTNFALPAKELMRLFGKTRTAVSTEETRYYLNGVYMHVAEVDGAKVLRCVATDGHRLARIDADLPEGAEEMPGVIVTRKAIVELGKLLEGDSDDIAVSVSETKIRFATPEVTLTSKVIDGTFPDYVRVIPIGNERKMEVDAVELTKAVDRVATVSREISRAVKMTIDTDRLVLSVNDPEIGTAQEELAVAYGDDRLEIGFNARYLLEISSQVERENAVFHFNTSSDPAIICESDDPGALYVVMPMRT